MSALGDFVTHTAPNPTKAKRYMQETNGGPVALVELLESTSTNTHIRCAAAGTLWNMLDTSEIRVRGELVQRMVDAACVSMHCLFLRRKPKKNEAGALAAGVEAAAGVSDSRCSGGAGSVDAEEGGGAAEEGEGEELQCTTYDVWGCSFLSPTVVLVLLFSRSSYSVFLGSVQ